MTEIFSHIKKKIRSLGPNTMEDFDSFAGKTQNKRTVEFRVMITNQINFFRWR